jgi:hypothetical protein
VCYYEVDMASEENLTEEEMNLGRTEGLYLTPLGSPMPRKSSAELRGRAVPDVASGGGSRAVEYKFRSYFLWNEKKNLRPRSHPQGATWGVLVASWSIFF